MAKELSTTMRSRRVIYDDYTGGFYVETRVEALQRQSENRASETDVLNKSQEAKFEFAQRQIEAARRIFERKLLVDVNQHKQNLKERIAYKHILDDLTRKNGSSESDSDSRVYGFDGSRVELQALIEKRIKECSPSSRRRKAADKLLTKRKPVAVFDRGRSTSALLRSAKTKRYPRSSNSDARGRLYSRQSNAQLILPPISMSINHTRASSNGSALVSLKNTKVTKDTDLTLPSVFITPDGHG